MNKLYPVFISFLMLTVWQANSQTTDIAGPVGSGNYGKAVVVLTNGNYVVTDPLFDEAGIVDRGAVYLYNGSTHALISTLKGGTFSDQIGSGGVIALTNGNFVVISTLWNNGAAADVGAVTWGNGVTGVAGLVSSSNSLVGSFLNDQVGSLSVFPLTNGNYVVCSPVWNNVAVVDAGAVTWGSGTTGVTGTITSTNSLVGTKAGDFVGGGGVTVLTNGHYVASSPAWGNTGAAAAGAVTWGNGTTGRTGSVTNLNSLVGTKLNDAVGSTATVALTNGNYVMRTATWDNAAIADVGAVTWGNGTTGRVGNVSNLNSLIGVVANDGIGNTVTALSNGNYVVASLNWDNGAVLNTGAATWCDGSAGRVGTVTTANSLVGSSADDNIGSGGITALSNGNYVVESSVWNNGAVLDAGAATWGNGTTGTTSIVASGNSLVGSQSLDQVGINVVPLTNGNYVVRSAKWDNGGIADVGAATWGNGATGTTGPVTTANSLYGSTTLDNITSGGVSALTNGNYVVRSQVFDNGAVSNAGAVTWGNGTTGTTGAVTSANSLVGSTTTDNVGKDGLTALSNGNYVVRSTLWDGTAANTGAVTWGNGNSAITGVVSSTNSLVGSTVTDNIGNGGVTALPNGNYAVLSSTWNNGALADASAVTYGIGSTGTSGVITNCNSVLGGVASPVAPLVFDYDNTYSFLIVGRPSENIVSIFRPASMGLAVTLDTKSVSLVGASPTPLIANAGCRIIASLTPNGALPVSGSLSSEVWVEVAQPINFVQRHYEILPATNATTATGAITLYFTQPEFDNFNALYTIKLPTGPSDVTGIANLLVEQHTGTSSNGTGLPGTYPGGGTTINPVDANVIWNSALSRWEVTFNVTGFGGYFVKTFLAVLPVELLSFSTVLTKDDALVNWTTTNEINAAGYEVERSVDARVFTKIGSTKAANTPGDHSYQYRDLNVTALDAPTVYYRLKEIDIDGKSVYSQVVALHLNKNNSVSIFPNPSTTVTTLRISNSALLHTMAQLSDLQGKQLKQFMITSYQERIDIGNLPKGIYVLKLADGTAIKLNKN